MQMKTRKCLFAVRVCVCVRPWARMIFHPLLFSSARAHTHTHVHSTKGTTEHRETRGFSSAHSEFKLIFFGRVRPKSFQLPLLGKWKVRVGSDSFWIEPQVFLVMLEPLHSFFWQGLFQYVEKPWKRGKWHIYSYSPTYSYAGTTILLLPLPFQIFLLWL